MTGRILDDWMRSGTSGNSKKRVRPDTSCIENDDSQSKRAKTGEATESKKRQVPQKRKGPDKSRLPSGSDSSPSETRGIKRNDNDSNESVTDKNATNPSTDTLRITESLGDIFDAPKNTLLVHACNCLGSWDAGIAKAFRLHYPSAFKKYQAHCKSSTPAKLAGTALLIPPCEYAPKRKGEAPRHYVGCLFTSKAFGRRRDSPSEILKATGPSMKDLLRHVAEWNERGDAEETVGEVRICKINSGLFNVPWEKTRAVLEGIEADGSVEEVKVISREE